ncbi:MAG: hypothetical protein ACREEE_02375 [Dongiaceae bacterium]
MIATAFAVDPSVRWVAIGRPGEQPIAHYRPGVVALNGDASDEAEERIANPAMISLARARGQWDLDGLRFIIVAYGKLTQIIIPLDQDSHVSCSLDAESEPWKIAGALASALAPVKMAGAASNKPQPVE